MWAADRGRGGESSFPLAVGPAGNRGIRGGAGLRKGAPLAGAEDELRAEVTRLRQRVAALEQGERGRLEELRQSQALYRALVENAFAGICIADPDENITYANPALAEIMGYAVEEMAGLNLSEVTEPREFARYQQMTQQRRRGLRNSFESVVRRKDGRRINVLLSAAPLSDGRGDYSDRIIRS